MSEPVTTPRTMRTLLLGFLLLAWSGVSAGCAKEEPIQVPEADQQAPDEQAEASGVADDQGATPEAEAAAAESGESVEEVEEVEEAEPTKLGGSSLRDRITVTPAPPEKASRWSTAETIEERRANLDKALAKEQGP
ncbi:MAG: hypothetical protein ACYSU1_00220, partial [Planctomycetota bacterium]